MAGKPTSLDNGNQIGGSHYKGLAIEPAHYAHVNGLGFLEGSAIKYITRHKLKGMGVDDLKKAAHFVAMLLEMEYGVVALTHYKEQDKKEPEEMKPALLPPGWMEYVLGQRPPEIVDRGMTAAEFKAAMRDYVRDILAEAEAKPETEVDTLDATTNMSGISGNDGEGQATIHGEATEGKWEVFTAREPAGEPGWGRIVGYQIRWSIPNEAGEYLWVGHYFAGEPDEEGKQDPTLTWCRHAADRHAERFSEEWPNGMPGCSQPEQKTDDVTSSESWIAGQRGEWIDASS